MRKWRPYIIVSVLWIAYAALSLAAPVVHNPNFQLSDTGIQLLKISIILPVLVIWLIAAHGARLFQHYARLVKGSPEGVAMRNISRGINWAVAYLICISLPGAIAPYIHGHQAHQAWIMVGAYLPLTLAFAAFAILYFGSQQLGRISKSATWTLPVGVIAALYLVFCAAFALLFYEHPTILGNTGPTSITRVLGHGMILFTVILPYLVTWFLGLITVANIVSFRRNVSGSIYRVALRNLVTGVLGVVGFAIVLQVFDLFAPALAKLGIGGILLVLYGLILLYGLGFVFIASGAKKLIRIEEVA